MTTPTSKKRRKGCGIGCGIFALVVIIAISLTVYIVGHPVREAKRSEQDLNERFAVASEYTPPPNGSVAPERIEAFLRVRERLHKHCTGFQVVLDNVLHLEGLEQDQEKSKSTKLYETVRSFKELFGIGPKFLKFVKARNSALLKEEMGLGEYIYIYVLAYSDQLRQLSISKYAQMDKAYISDRTRTELTQILRNQLATLNTGERSMPNNDMASALQEEISALEQGRQSFPWQHGQPPAIAASFSPYVNSLARLYCEGITKIELLQKNKGFQVKG